MAEVFLIPVSNKHTLQNFNNSILNIDEDNINYLKNCNINTQCKFWGLAPGKINTSQWNKMNNDDIIIFVEKDRLTFTKIINKSINKDISKLLWKKDMWELILFIDLLFHLPMKKKTFLTSLGYSDKDNLMGNRRITEKFRDNYPSINDLQTKISSYDIDINTSACNITN